MTEDETVSIDGRRYRLSDLTEGARMQLQNVRLADQEVARLKMQLALAQTGRNAYAIALRDELDGCAEVGQA